MRTPGTAAALEARRRRAASLLSDGKSIAETALLVDASISSVKRWKRAVQEGGSDALAAIPHPGPSPRLNLRQREALVRILLRGPCAAGYATELWTCRRVAEVVQRRFGVTYHPDHLGRLLHTLGFSPQKPTQRARERDEAAILRWHAHDWPRIKKRDATSELALFFSMKAASGCSR
jgi:transposase